MTTQENELHEINNQRSEYRMFVEALVSAHGGMPFPDSILNPILDLGVFGVPGHEARAIYNKVLSSPSNS